MEVKEKKKSTPIEIGEHRLYKYCRFCYSANMSPVINLGEVPLAGGFIKNLQLITSEKFYPLVLSFCQDCYLLQSVNVINADILFKDYFYHSSAIKTLTSHFTDIANEIKREFNNRTDTLVVEIGSNDGTFIKELLNKNIKAIGVDPAKNIVEPLQEKNVPIINDYYTEEVAKNIKEKNGQADVIFSSNTMAHIEDMHTVIKGIKLLLKPDGYLMFEVHYLSNLLNEMQYDFIYHEHQYYYSLITLQKIFAMYDMEIFDVKPINIHAGSMRYYIQHKKNNKRKVTNNVTNLLENELHMGFHKIETYINYGEKVAKTKYDLLKLLSALKADNYIIAGYGASGRGTIIMNYCRLDITYLDYVIDDAPAKQGAYTPGNHLEIVSSNILKTTQKPDYVLLFAWSFAKEIIAKNKDFIKNGGSFIIPLPTPQIISTYND